MKNNLLAALLLAAACGTPPEVLPPPFGPDFPRDTHLFFPSGLAITSSGVLLVANGNFNHAYDAGTIVALPADFVKSFFDGRLSGDQPIPAKAPALMIGNYAGPLRLNNARTAAYTASRDTGVLNGIALDPSGNMSCAPPASATSNDCRKGVIDLKAAANLDGPYSIVPGIFEPFGGGAQTNTFFVSSVVPHIDGVSSGVTETSSNVAALDMTDPTKVLFTIPVGTLLVANGTAPGPMDFDPVNRRLYLAGCYQRFVGTGAGEPGSGKCASIGVNLLRVVEVDAQALALPRVFNLYGDVHSVDTTQILLGDFDATTGAPHALWATMNNPDMLARVELPDQFSSSPRVNRAVPLAISPADIVRIPRSGDSDLLAIVSERASAITFYDTGADALVGQVDGLGDRPFNAIPIACPNGSTTSACLVVSVFNECRVAFVEVPLATPWTAVLHGRAGGCL